MTLPELVKDTNDILRMVRELAADDSRDAYIKQVAGSAENLIDALRAQLSECRALLARGVADRDETEIQFAGMPTQIRNSTIEDCRAALKTDAGKDKPLTPKPLDTLTLEEIDSWAARIERTIHLPLIGKFKVIVAAARAHIADAGKGEKDKLGNN